MSSNSLMKPSVAVLAGVASFMGLAAVLVGPAQAGESVLTRRGSDVICTPVADDVIQIDGLVDDWDGVTGQLWAGSDRKDASFEVRCNVDDTTLYLLVDVRDEWLVRRGARDKRGPEDALELTLGRATFEVLPADADRRVGRKLVGKVRGLQLADARQERGFAVELAVPRAAVGLGRGVVSTPLAVRFTDVDMRANAAVDETVTTPPGATLTLAEGDAVFTQFLADQRLKPSDVWFDQRANVDGEPGAERVIAAGRTIAVLSDRYGYMQVGVPRKDILSIALESLDVGGRRKSIVVRTIERNDLGSREVLSVWHVAPDLQFNRVAGVELAVETREGRITNSWSIGEAKWTPSGQRRPRKASRALIFKPAASKGAPASADAWHLAPAEDMMPVLLPWDEAKGRVIVIDGDVAQSSEQ